MSFSSQEQVIHLQSFFFANISFDKILFLHIYHSLYDEYGFVSRILFYAKETLKDQ